MRARSFWRRGGRSSSLLSPSSSLPPTRARHSGRPHAPVEGLEVRRLLAFTVTGSPNWVEQGPGPATGGQTAGLGAQNNPVAGAVEALAAHPTDANTLYAATINGGVWRTTNATSASPTWTPLTDLFDSLSMSAIAFDPLDSSDFSTLYAGYGQFSSGGDSGRNSGVIRTTDGGATWAPVAEGTFDNRGIRQIVPTTVTTATGQVVLVGATTGGIFRSADGAATFTQISGAPGSGLPAGGVTHLTGDPSNNQRYYTTRAGVGAYRSDDAGATWTLVNGTGANTLTVANTARIEITVHNSAGNNVIYAGTITNGGQLGGVFRSTDQGANWTRMDVPGIIEGGGNFVGLHPREKDVTVPGGQGRIHFSIVADPADPDLVYVGGDRQPRTGPDGIEGNADDAWPNAVGANNFTGRLFIGDASQAAGSQWTPVTDNGAGGTGPHADSRDMVIDANGNIIESDDGGIYRLTDIDNSSGNRRWASVNGNLRITEFYHVSYDPVNNTIVGGTQDVGSSEQNGSGNFTWRQVSQGDGATTAVDVISSPGNAIHYTSAQNLGSFQRRTLNGSNAQVGQANLGLAVAGAGAHTIRTIDTSVQFTNPYVLNNVDGTRMLVGTRFLYESTNRGDTFTALGGLFDLTGDGIDNDGVNGVDDGNEFRLNPTGSVGTVNDMVYGGRADTDSDGTVENFADVAWVASSTGVRLRTTAGGPFNALTNYPAFSATDIAVDPNDWRVAYVTDGSDVYFTSDQGATWTTVTGNLDDFETDIRSIEVVTAAAQDVLLVGGSLGVWRTLDIAADATWSEYGLGLPNVYVKELTYNAADDVLVAGTWGRGAWTVPNASTTIAQESCLIIDGTSGADTITLVRDANNPLLLDATMNADSITVNLTSLSCIEINGLAGEDEITVDGTNGLILVSDHFDINAGDDADDVDASGSDGDNVVINGDGGDDTLVGGAGDDQLDGGTGDDTLDGRGGADNFAGGTGVDTADYSLRTNDLDVSIDGAADDGELGEGDNVNLDVENVLGGSGDDTIAGSDFDNLLVGNDGEDLIFGEGGDDELRGNNGDDEIHGGDGADDITGGNDDDDLFGDAGDDSIAGNDGDDDLIGGDGADDMLGGDGFDVMLGDDGVITATATLIPESPAAVLRTATLASTGTGNDTMSGGADDDFMYGQGGNDGMTGDGGDDAMEGNGGADTMAGNDGDDDMVGGSSSAGAADGGDSMTGGTGHDVMLGDNGRIVRVVLLPANAYDRYDAGVPAGTGEGLENGAPKRDVFLLDLDRIGGNDVMAGEAGDDVMHGGLGNDLMTGGDGHDDMFGELGADTMDGGAGDDGMLGDKGTIVADLLDGADEEVITTQDHKVTETVNSAGTRKRFVALADADVGADDVMTGGTGDDSMHGGAGADDIQGQAGEDAMFGDAGPDLMAGGTEDDHLFGGFGNDNMDGNAGNDILYGGDGDDRLVADNVNDRLLDWFGNFNDFIVPGPGYGAQVIIRSAAPPTMEFLLALAEADGALDAFGEIALVVPPSPTNAGPGGRAS